VMRRCTVTPQDPSCFTEQVPARRNDPILVADVQRVVSTSQLVDQPRHRRRRTANLAEKANLAAASAVGDRHAMLHLRRVEGDKSLAILPHGPPSVREARLGLSEQPSLLFCTNGRAAGLNPGT
jgi:hypothetical protein